MRTTTGTRVVATGSAEARSFDSIDAQISIRKTHAAAARSTATGSNKKDSQSIQIHPARLKTRPFPIAHCRPRSICKGTAVIIQLDSHMLRELWGGFQEIQVRQ